MKTVTLSPPPQQTLHTAWKYVLAAIASLLALVWCGVWLLNLRVEVGMAASIAALCLALAVVALREVLSGRVPNRAAQQDGVAHPPALAGAAAEPDPRVEGKRWSLDVFDAIDARRFAAVCETWFAWAGFDTRAQSHQTDEGVDIWLHAARMPGPVAIVRCKHWPDKQVGLPEMKDFLGLVAAHKSAHGTYTTTSTYTPEALQFAQEHGIDAVDGRGLLRRIQTRTRQRQQALLAVAFSGQA